MEPMTARGPNGREYEGGEAGGAASMDPRAKRGRYLDYGPIRRATKTRYYHEQVLSEY